MISALLSPLLKYIAGGLAILCLVLGIALKIERAHSAKQAEQIVKLTDQLKAISTKRNEQKSETTERVRTVVRTVHDADGRAKAIEAEPLPGNCATPKAVLDADI